MFKRKKRFKPYRMKPIRVKSWREIAWAEVMLFVGVLGILFAALRNMLASVVQACTNPDLSQHDDDDWFKHNKMSFDQDDDDTVRGQWDSTSFYYLSCHSDDHRTSDDD